MTVRAVAAAAVLLLALAASITPASAFLGGWAAGGGVASGANGGTECAVCTIGVGLVEQFAELHNKTASEALAEICKLLPSKLQQPCTEFVDLAGPYIIELIDELETPDVVCKALKACTGDCMLFPPPTEGMVVAVERARHTIERRSLRGLPPLCNLPLFKEICEAINNFGNHHEPLDDLDADGFSPIHTLRGADWRGKDCDDRNANVRPGRIPDNSDTVYDSNCNGIYGVDPKTNKPYEELLCSDTKQQGVIVLGDSASAHFHVQPQYLNVTAWDSTTFSRILPVLENEFDWPLFSSTTGFEDTRTMAPDINGPSNSSYQVMRSRNRCVHRDFQNIAVNGARAGSMNSTIVQSMSRNQTFDEPALVVYALIGNDVCNGHPDTFAHMTTPEAMHAAALDTMHYLDTQLPKGSHVVLTGLANGSILYETMANRIHPIGALHNNVPTKAVYDFLNCLQISPCRGWMNSNATMREMTTAHAVLLSNVLKNISDQYTFKNFDTAYFENPIADAVVEWERRGGQAYELIEPVDGFHPSQWAQPLITEFFWRFLEEKHSSFMAPVNPHNAEIESLFGDQGGY